MAKTQKVVFSSTCPTCGRGPNNPFRSHFQLRIVSGCVDHFHTGHLVTPGDSAAWHARPEAKKIRAASKAMRDGWVTEFEREPKPGERDAAGFIVNTKCNARGFHRFAPLGFNCLDCDYRQVRS